jgi:lactoylglutathione lyase
MSDGFRNQISGVYETHLPVANLARAITFYRDVLGLELAREFPERGIAFFWVGDKTQGMLGLWQNGSALMWMSSHFAFRMTKEAVLAAPDRLAALGVAPLERFSFNRFHTLRL